MDVNATASDSAPAEIAAAATTNLTLPVFTPSDVASWFLRTESLFRLKNITSSQKKADFVIGALPGDVFSRISRWWAHARSDALCYDDLKAQIIRHCDPTPEEKSQRILNLLKMPLGDRRPSDALFELRNLATIHNPDGTESTLDTTLILWLLLLPSEVRTHINAFDNKADFEIAAQADSLVGRRKLSLTTPSTIAPAYPAQPDSGCDDHEDDCCAAASQRRRRPPFQQQPPNNKQKTLCYYHQRYGRDAKNCRSPCSFSKNW